MKQAVILLNLGTPDAPTAAGLRRFYRYFFADPYVFDMNPVGRWLLRNLIIQPLRAPRTARDYATIWMEEGSPLKVYADRLRTSVQQSFDKAQRDVLVLNGMAYSRPFIHESMAQLEQLGVEEILVLPLFPQYSYATTASVFNGVKQAADNWRLVPRLHFVDDLYSEAAFIESWGNLIQKHLDVNAVDHVIFSYHGLPEQTIKKIDTADHCQFNDCCEQIEDSNRHCYRAQCLATTRQIVAGQGWRDDFYSMAFQSRFGRQVWIQPYLDKHIQALLQGGKKKIAVLTPSFVSDCLETIHEIGVEYREQFMEAGGEYFALVPNLNDDPFWLDAVYRIASAKLDSIGTL